MDVEEMVAKLQADQAVDALMLMTLIQSSPDPIFVRRMWTIFTDRLTRDGLQTGDPDLPRSQTNVVGRLEFWNKFFLTTQEDE